MSLRSAEQGQRVRGAPVRGQTECVEGIFTRIALSSGLELPALPLIHRRVSVVMAMVVDVLGGDLVVRGNSR